MSSTDLTVRMDALTLEVEGFGRAKFPVTPAKARKLTTLRKPARFGRGENTLTDPEVRDTWEIPVAYRGSRDALSVVAFYADCQHEVLKLKSGYRITLTTTCCRAATPPLALKENAGAVAELTGLLREHFAAPAASSWGRYRADPPSRLVYLLDHEYTPRAPNWTRMKGSDARRVPLLREAAETAGYEAILGLAKVRTTHDAWPADEGYEYPRYYDEDEEEDYEDEPAEPAEYNINDLISTEL